MSVVRTAYNMKKYIALLLLWACTVTCEPLRLAIQRRSDRPGIYASDYMRDYRPYTYMAIPLHAPVPVLHVLSSAPLYRPNRGANRYTDRPKVYASSMSHTWLAPPPTVQPLMLNPVESAPTPEVVYARPSLQVQVESVPAPQIIYARPKPNGGYEYSKTPFKKRTPTTPKEPTIIRIHKYRVIKDDR